MQAPNNAEDVEISSNAGDVGMSSSFCYATGDDAESEGDAEVSPPARYEDLGQLGQGEPASGT